MHEKLPPSFYASSDVVGLARKLLGKVLATNIDGIVTKGKIVETEAYNGPDDRASHASGGRRTARTEVMFREGGLAYVYRCYGIHYLLNVVCGPADIPLAVLIRGLEPLAGIEAMLSRRGMTTVQPRLSAGPGTLCQSLGVTIAQNGLSLTSDVLWIEDAAEVPSGQIETGTRVGVAYAGTDALRPYRFWIRNNPFVSKAKGLPIRAL